MNHLFITGVSGFLGGELLVELSKRKNIDKIFCLIRAKSQEMALQRLTKIFDFHGDELDLNRIVPIVGDLTDKGLAAQLKQNPLLHTVDTIIHSAANTSFSKIYDELVEKVNVGGTLHLLEWAKTLSHLKLFTYIGTATVCGNIGKNCLVNESHSPNPKVKHVVKYAYTKMMGELLLKEHLPAEKVLVLRPSIIMGDSRKWKPRSYVILWALATLNELRILPGNPNVKLDIVSIDYVTRSIIELVFHQKRKYDVYHISSGLNSASTPGKITDAVASYFPEKPSFQFVSRTLLNEMKQWSKSAVSITQENSLFPYKKHLEYWLGNFTDLTKLRMLFYALEPYFNFIELGHTFDNSRLLEDTGVGPSIPAHEYLQATGAAIREINIFEGT